MVKIFKAEKKRTEAQVRQTKELTITSMNHEGEGVCRDNDIVCFVEGALIGETVIAKLREQKKNYQRLTTQKVLTASAHRQTPFCAHFIQCGGCQLQYFDVQQQVLTKQQAVGELFEKFAKITISQWQNSILSPDRHYRRSARIAVFYHRQKKQFSLGFREQHSKNIINISQCDVLEQRFSQLFSAFNNLLPQLERGHAITHLQLCGVNHAFVIIRHTEPLTTRDLTVIAALGDKHEWQIVLAPKPNEYQYLNTLTTDKPSYQLNDNLTLSFNFDNFIQVNNTVNQQMVKQSIDWLEVNEEDNILDLFCGIGNFSLALAQRAANVCGVEGVESSVAMATQNALENNLSNATFYCQDLTQEFKKAPWFRQNYDYLVVDPSRVGALDALNQLALKRFAKILYVSCDPVTLARDSKLIVDSGFQLAKISLINMFPHTKHIETMALFIKK